VINIITVLTFLVTGGILFVLADQIRRAQQNPVKRRLEAASAMSNSSRGAKSDPGALWGSFAEQIPQPATSKAEIEFELRQAGYFHPSALYIFLGLRNGIVIAIVIATAVLAALIGPQREPLVIRIGVAGLAIAAMSYGIPRLVLKAIAKRRVERVAHSLPFALDLITMCLTGGLALRDSLGHVSAEIGQAHPDLSEELAIVQQHSDIRSMESAFRNFAARMNHPDISALVALIVQNQQLGTNVAQSIRDFAEGARLKWRQLADERAGKVSVHMLFPVVFCLLPAMFILLWGPAALDLADFFRNMEDRVGKLPDLNSINRFPQ
jgi:tight adherence protein C